MNWKIYDDVLVDLAVRQITREKGSHFAAAYKRYYIWHERWLIENSVHYHCYICGKNFASASFDSGFTMQSEYERMDKEARVHGINHLKEMNLLAFV